MNFNHMVALIQFKLKKPMASYAPKKQDKIINKLIDAMFPNGGLVSDTSIEVHVDRTGAGFLKLEVDTTAHPIVHDYLVVANAPVAAPVLDRTGVYVKAEVGKPHKSVAYVADFLTFVEEGTWERFVGDGGKDHVFDVAALLKDDCLPDVVVKAAADSIMAVVKDTPLVEDGALTPKGTAMIKILHSVEDPITVIEAVIAANFTTEEELLKMLEFNASNEEKDSPCVGCTHCRTVSHLYSSKKLVDQMVADVPADDANMQEQLRDMVQLMASSSTSIH